MNLLLPLALGFIILIFGVIFGFVIWILNKTKVISLTKNHHLCGVLRAAILSIIGVFVISGAVGIAVFGVQLVKGFFTK